VDFYITNVVTGLENASCGNFPLANQITLYHSSSATGSVDWVAPSTGQFIPWLWNYGGVPVSGTFSIQTPWTTTVSSISYVTAPTIYLLTLTTTAISQVGLPIANLGLFGAIAAVAVIAGVLVVARRRKPSVETALIREAPAAVQEAPRETVPPQPVITRAPPIVSTGYVDLDKALNGGIPEEFAVLIVSPSFDERDLLLRKVVDSAMSAGRLAILVSNDMGRIKDMASRYPNGFYALSPQADRISQHGPNLLKIPSFENLSDANISLGLILRDLLAKEKATKRIMIIDILSDLLLRHKSIVTRRWLTDFVGKRKTEGFTIIATLNPLTTTKEETQNIIDFFDGVIEIFEKPLMERSRRFLMIRKMYGQKYSDSEVLMDRDKLF
jgi:KaiC/GvpD/RAD55 family RecA-like ATPase